MTTSSPKDPPDRGQVDAFLVVGSHMVEEVAERYGASMSFVLSNRASGTESQDVPASMRIGVGQDIRKRRI